MINIQNIEKIYNGTKVLNIPHFILSEGESVGLIGNNGAGKTTLIRIMLDLILPNKGYILSQGTCVNKSEAWKKYTGAYLDEGLLINFLTAQEYFEFVGKLHGMSKGDVQKFLNHFEYFFNGEILNKKYIRDLSKGNQKKAGIAASLIGSPEILVLDEPFANLDPTSQIILKKILKDLKSSQKITMLISSHDLNHITEICERIVLLEKGKIVNDILTTETTLKELEDHFAFQP